MADLYSEGRLKMTKNAFFATLSLNILRTASNNILKLGTVLDGMYIYHHAEFQVNRCNFEGARPFLALSPNPACFVRTAAIIMQLGMAVAVVLPYNRAKLQANRSTTREAIPFLALSPNPSPI